LTDNVFVIGDVHGHLDRLEALLKQEGFLVRCEYCDGAGLFHLEHERDHSLPEWVDKSKLGTTQDCPFCLGEGQRRVRTDVTVVHLGDLGHFGHRGSPTGDILCYKYVTVNRWCDIVLWGNHDRASIDGAHHATDFMQVPEALHYIKILREEGRMQVAFDAHGFLITHAGLAAAFEYQSIPEGIVRDDPGMIADWLNDEDDEYLEGMDKPDHPRPDKSAVAVINAIGARRGGRVPTGGILWRDINEALYNGFRQIFGHSADPKHQVRYCDGKMHTRRPEMYTGASDWSYCIDVAGKGDQPGDNCLAGIYLPSEKIVRVDL
jgi:hypothetical protein